jgi:hypothetical protein
MRSVSKRRLKKKREGAYNLLGCGSLWVMYGTYVLVCGWEGVIGRSGVFGLILMLCTFSRGLIKITFCR